VTWRQTRHESPRRLPTDASGRTPLSGGHRSLGHSAVTTSCTFMSCDSANSVKSVSGYCADVGASCFTGSRPLRDDGIATGVSRDTAVVLRYSVDVPASRARLG
jgi:hypothetical protein